MFSGYSELPYDWEFIFFGRENMIPDQELRNRHRRFQVFLKESYFNVYSFIFSKLNLVKGKDFEIIIIKNPAFMQPINMDPGIDGTTATTYQGK